MGTKLYVGNLSFNTMDTELKTLFGQVGTVVEEIDNRTALVEFSDNHGQAYAVAPCPSRALLVLHYLPEAA